MRYCAIFCLLFSYGFMLSLDNVYQDAVNKVKTWKIGKISESPFANFTENELLAYFSMDPTIPQLSEIPPEIDIKNTHTEKITSPVNFDAREKWPKCIHPVKNQGQCGSCYAHGSSEVISDRFCIHSDGKINIVIAPQDAVSCGRLLCNGCYGCVYPYLWMYWYYYGGVTEECFPYTGTEQDCVIRNSQCQNPNVPYKKYYIKGSSDKYTYLDIEKVKQEIMTNGPISAIMYVTPDYLLYKGGVFVPTTNKIIGSHLMKVIGWGKDEASGLDYWLLQDSSGINFGEKGFSKIKMGVLGIDSHMSWAMPDLSRV